MKKSGYAEEQISYALRQAEPGTSVAEVIRRMGMAEHTFYRLEKPFAARRRRAASAQGENRKLK